MYSYQKILFNFSNIFFRHMWIANIRARNLKNASQASLLRNLWTSYLLTSWKLTKFDNCLIHFFCKKWFGPFVSEQENKYYTRHQKKTPRFPMYLFTVCSRYKWFLTASYASLAVLEIEWNFGCTICSKITISLLLKFS